MMSDSVQMYVLFLESMHVEYVHVIVKHALNVTMLYIATRLYIS